MMVVHALPVFEIVTNSNSIYKAQTHSQSCLSCFVLFSFLQLLLVNFIHINNIFSCPRLYFFSSFITRYTTLDSEKQPESAPYIIYHITSIVRQLGEFHSILMNTQEVPFQSKELQYLCLLHFLWE